jgi:hypothetical protein
VEEAASPIRAGDEIPDSALVRAFDPGQRAFALALCRLAPSGNHSLNDVRNMAETILGRPYHRATFRARVLRPLRNKELISYRQEGAGTDAATVVRLLPRFEHEILAPYLESELSTLDPSLAGLFNLAPGAIRTGLGSPDRGEATRSLDALAVLMMRLLGFRMVAWQRRAAASEDGRENGLEVVGTSSGRPARWAIHAINRPGSVPLTTVAQAVGMSVVTRTSHVLMATTSTFSDEVDVYAGRVAMRTDLRVLLMDGTDLDHLVLAPGALPTMVADRIRTANRLHVGTVSPIRGLSRRALR